MDIQTILQFLTALGAGTLLKTLVDTYSTWKKEKLSQESKKIDKKAADEEREDSHRFELEKSTVDVLKETLKHEREINARYMIRINSLEAHNAELQLQIGILRNALLASFVNDLETAKRLLASIPPPKASDPNPLKLKE